MSHDDCHGRTSKQPHCVGVATCTACLSFLRCELLAWTITVGAPRLQVLDKRTELRQDQYEKWDEVVTGDGHGGISRDIQLLTSGRQLGFEMSGVSRLAVASFMAHDRTTTCI